MSSTRSGTKPAVDLYIQRPDGTTTRFVRKTKSNNHQGISSSAADGGDEDAHAVRECAPYTASFNALLTETRPHENPQRFVALILDRMHAEDIPLNTVTYNLLMRRLVRFTDGSIFRLYEEFKAEGTRPNCSVRPDVETFRMLFRACERGAEYQKAFLLYEQMRHAFHLLPETAVYNTLLGFCAAVKDVAQASYFVEEMRANGVPMDANTYNCLMSCLVASAPYKQTLEVFQSMLESGVMPTVRTYNTVIKAARLNHDYDRSFQLFEEMKKKGLIPDVVTYNNLLCACHDRFDYILGQGRYQGARRTREQVTQGLRALADLALTLLSEMHAINVEPNTFSYNRVLAVLSGCHDHRIFTVYQRLQVAARYTEQVESGPAVSAQQQQQQQPVSRRTDAASSAQYTPDDNVEWQLEKALTSESPHGESNIAARGVHPNVDTYQYIMDACVQVDHLDRCKQIAEDMTRRGVRMQKGVAMLLLGVCVSLKDTNWATRILSESKKLGLVVDAPFFNLYLQVLVAAGEMPLALRLFERTCQGINEYGAKADAETYNCVAQGLVAEKRVPEADALLQSMTSSYATVQANSGSYCLMIDICDITNDLDAPERLLLQLLEDKDTPVGVDVVHRVLRFYADHKDQRAEEWFQRLEKRAPRTLPPTDVECYNALMEYHSARGEYDAAQKLFDTLKGSHQLEADATSYRILFEMYAKTESKRSMVLLFDDARIHSIPIDESAYNAILPTFIAAKDPYIYDIFRHMKSNGVPFSEETMAILMRTPDGRQVLNEIVARGLMYEPPLVPDF